MLSRGSLGINVTGKFWMWSNSAGEEECLILTGRGSRQKLSKANWNIATKQISNVAMQSNGGK